MKAKTTTIIAAERFKINRITAMILILTSFETETLAVNLQLRGRRHILLLRSLAAVSPLFTHQCTDDLEWIIEGYASLVSTA